MSIGVAQSPELDQILADAEQDAVRLDDSKQQLIAASAVVRARTEETLGHLAEDQAGADLSRGLNLALRLMEQARSTNNLLAAAQLALAGRHLSEVGIFNERHSGADRPVNTRAFKSQ